MLNFIHDSDGRSIDRLNVSDDRERLERIDTLTRTLLHDVQYPEQTTLENAAPKTRTEARDRILQIRVETSMLVIQAIGLEAAIPYRLRAFGFEYRLQTITQSAVEPNSVEATRLAAQVHSRRDLRRDMLHRCL